MAYTRRALKILEGRRQRELGGGGGEAEEDTHMGAAATLGLAFDGASISMSWHSAEGAVALLPPRGQFA